MMLLRSHHRVNGTQLVTTRLYRVDVALYSVLVIRRTPNPKYANIHWLDTSPIPSHLYETTSSIWPNLESAQSAYRLVTALTDKL